MLGSVVDRLHSICKFLGSLPSTVKQNGTSHLWLLLSKEELVQTQSLQKVQTPQILPQFSEDRLRRWEKGKGSVCVWVGR